MTSSASIVPIHFRYAVYTLCNTTLLATEILPLFVRHSSSQNHTSPSTGLSTTQVRWNSTEEVSIDPIRVTPICLPVNRTPLLYTSLRNQLHEGLRSDSHCSPHLRGPRRSAHVAELYVSVCPRHLSLPMSNDRPIARFELRMRVAWR